MENVIEKEIGVEDFGEDKEAKIWSVWGDSFGEINVYLLTFSEAVKMAKEELNKGDFEDIIIYCPAAAKRQNKSQ